MMTGLLLVRIAGEDSGGVVKGAQATHLSELIGLKGGVEAAREVRVGELGAGGEMLDRRDRALHPLVVRGVESGVGADAVDRVVPGGLRGPRGVRRGTV